MTGLVLRGGLTRCAQLNGVLSFSDGREFYALYCAVTSLRYTAGPDVGLGSALILNGGPGPSGIVINLIGSAAFYQFLVRVLNFPLV